MALADFRNSIVTQDKFSATFNKFDKAVSKSAQGADTAAKSLSGGGLMALAGGAAGVFAAQQIGRTIWSLGELGAQSLTTKASFENLMSAVGQSPALLDRLSAAAGGTITEMTLMQQANSALAGTTGQLSQEMAAALPKLLEAGRAAAKLNPAYGDAAFMFQSLVSGVKRGTPMLIDNTGITLKVGEANEAYAKSIGKSVTELTAQERSIAILRATLQGADTLITQAGGSTLSMAEKMMRSTVAVDGLKTALAELVAPSVADAAEAMTTPVQRLTDLLSGDEMTRASMELQILNEHMQAGGPIALLAARRIDTLRQRIGELSEQELETGRAASLAAQMTAQYGGAADKAATASATFSDQLAGLIATARGGGAAMQSLIGYINGVSAAANAGGKFTGFLGGVDVMSQSQYVAVTEQRIAYERALNVQVAANILTQEQADYQLATFDRRVNDHIGTLRDATKATSDYSSAQDDLKSKIGSALTPTFDLSGLTGGALGGMGGDSFDEAYKRLAAVALRPEELQIHAGDWADTFAKAGLTGLSPEDAQARAKELVEAYSKGLDFSLIDREKIKDSVRQAIKAEELYNTIVDEIYAEMGKPNARVDSAGYSLGQKVAKGMVRAARDGAPDFIDTFANAVAPSVAKIIRQDDARYNQ